MKNIRLLFFSLLLFQAGFGQYFRITNDTTLLKNSELVLQNSTSGLTGGFIKNKGNGRTEFAYAVDSVRTGHDTIFFHRGDGWSFYKVPSSYTDAAARAANAGLYPSLSVGYVDPPWIASLPASKITGLPAGGGAVSGTVAELRAMSTTTGTVYTSTDRGGGTWVDEGLNDGGAVDDGAIYIITANGHRLKRQYSGPVNVLWFGVVGDGATNNTSLLTTVLNTYHDVYFPNGVYVSNSKIPVIGNTRLVITGGDSVTIKSTGTGRFAGGYFDFTNCSNIDISGINFDLGKGRIAATYSSSDYGTWYNTGINFETCSNMSVTNCTFTNLYNRSINVHSSSGKISFTRNTFSSPVQNQGYSAEHVVVISFAGNADISDNKFINAAYTLPEFGICNINVSPSTGSVRVANNYMDYSGRDNTYTHRVCGIDFYSNSENVTIENNKMFHVMAQAIRTKDGRNFNIMGNYVEVTAVGIDPITEISSVTLGVETENIKVANNTFKTSISGLYAIEVVETFKNRQIKNVNLYNNTFDGFSFGVYCVNGISGLTSTDNTFKNAVNGYYITSQFTDTASIEKIYISDKNTSFSGIGINIGMPNGFIGKIDKINIEDNTLTGSSPSFIGVASININRPDILTVNHNRIKGGNVGIYNRDAVSSYIFDNIVDSCTYPTLDVGFSYAKQKGNYFNGALQDPDSAFLRAPSGTVNYLQKVVNSRVVGNSLVSDDNTTITMHAPTLTQGDVLTTGRFYNNVNAPGDNSVIFQNSSPEGLGLYSKGGSRAIPYNYSAYIENIEHDTLFFLMSDGRLGLGKLNPFYRLDVKGKVNFDSAARGVPATQYYELMTLGQFIDSSNNLLKKTDSTAIYTGTYLGGNGTTGNPLDVDINKIRNVGTVTFTGDGSTTSFTFPKSIAGLSSLSKVFVTPRTAIGTAVEWVDVSTESFTVHFTSAPTSGTKTLDYQIVVEPISP